MVANKSLLIKFPSSKDQLVDIFTKPLSSSRFSLLRSKLNVTTVPFSLRGRVSDKVQSNTKTQDSRTLGCSTEDRDRSCTSNP